MRAVAEQHGLNYVNLAEVVIPPSVVELVPEAVARENAVLPLSEGDGRLTVILSDPMEIDTLEKLRFISIARSTWPWPPAKPSWRPSIATTARPWARAPTRCCKSSPIRPSTLPRPSTRAARRRGNRRDPVPRSFGWCNLIITEAVQARASDIHIEPFEDRIRVRYRIDGMLIESDSPPKPAAWGDPLAH